MAECPAALQERPKRCGANVARLKQHEQQLGFFMGDWVHLFGLGLAVSTTIQIIAVVTDFLLQ